MQTPIRKDCVFLYLNPRNADIVITRIRYLSVKQGHMKYIYIIENILRIFARGMTASSSNFESPLFKGKTGKRRIRKKRRRYMTKSCSHARNPLYNVKLYNLTVITLK